MKLLQLSEHSGTTCKKKKLHENVFTVYHLLVTVGSMTWCVWVWGGEGVVLLQWTVRSSPLGGRARGARVDGIWTLGSI